MRPAVLICRAVFPEVVERLRATFDVETNDDDTPWPQPELIARLQGKAGALVTGGERIDRALLVACPELRAVCSLAVGYDRIDVDACTAHGVLVSNAPGVLTETTADFAFALLMAAARRIGESERFLRTGAWTRWQVDGYAAGDVHGTTLGILGMGRIGAAVARRGAHGFGMKVIYHNRTRLPAADEAAIGARYVDKRALLAGSDHLVIALPYTPASHHAIGAAELAAMKPTATLVNIARGGVVDDASLAEALHAGRLAAAGLDVFEAEPQVHPRLLDAPGAVLTPHIASASLATRRAMCGLAADNLLAALVPGWGAPPAALNASSLGPFSLRSQV